MNSLLLPINSHRMTHLARMVLMFCAGAFGTLASAAPCTDGFDPASPVLSSGFTYNVNNTRNNPSSINASNVSGLQVALTHGDAKVTEKRTAPIVTQQAIVFTSGRSVIAMNRLSGCTYWTYQVEDKSTFLIGTNAARSSSLAYIVEPARTPLIVVGDFYAKAHAVDARTGKLVWSRFLGHDDKRNLMTGGFQYHQGKLIASIATKEVYSVVVELFQSCCVSHGMLHAVNPHTGATIWKYEPTVKGPYNWTTFSNGPSGMSILAVPAIDPGRNQLYIGTGQNLSYPATSNSDSIVALDLTTGKTKWVFQGTADDVWNAACQAPDIANGKCPKGSLEGDFDFSASAILAKTRLGRDLILAGQKSGVVYALDPASGAKVWERRLGMGGSLGGVHWGMAIDANKVFVAVTDLWVNKLGRINTNDLNVISGGVQTVSAASMEIVKDGTPGLYALDIDTGAVVWEKHLTRTVADGSTAPVLFSAALSVTNDVLFAGGLDGVVRAFHTADGRPLWSHNTAVPFTDTNGQPGNGGTIDSVGAIVAGTDLLVNSGYSVFGGANAFQAGPGNGLFVFRLPGR